MARKLLAHVTGGKRFDERRNNSRAFRPPPDALPAAIAAIVAWRRADPAHAAWVAAGAPTLTSLDHVERFGVEYGKPPRRRGK